MQESGGASERAVWIALVIVYIAWGSTYVAIRYMDETVPPLIGAGIRFVAAGALMYAYVWRRDGRAPRLTRRELGSVALLGVLLPAGGNGLVSIAERHVPAGLASLVVASVPLWLLLMRWLSRERPSHATLTGLAIGFVGVGLVVFRGGSQQGVSVPHLLIVVVAAISWALGSWLSPRLPMPADVATGTSVEMLVGGLVMSAVGPVVGEHWSVVLEHASVRSLLAIVYLALFGSILAYTAYVWVLGHAPISRVSTYAYVNPVVAVLLGALLLGERITPIMAVGGAVIIVAVAVVIRAERTSLPQAERASELGALTGLGPAPDEELCGERSA